MAVCESMTLAAERIPNKETASRHLYADIVVALDESELPERIFKNVEPLARASGSNVTCLRTVEPVNHSIVVGTPPSGGAALEPLPETEKNIMVRTSPRAVLLVKSSAVHHVRPRPDFGRRYARPDRPLRYYHDRIRGYPARTCPGQAIATSDAGSISITW